jgi:hypothetical protein
MSEDERSSIQYPLEIYARRGWVALQVVIVLLFALFLLGVALFNWTGEETQRVPAALLAPFLLYVEVRLFGSTGRRSCAGVPEGHRNLGLGP